MFTAPNENKICFSPCPVDVVKSGRCACFNRYHNKTLKKIIIAGSRDFLDQEFLDKTLDEIIKSKENIEIVSGLAPGADTLGKNWAKKNEIPVKPFPANWKAWGKSAGYRRNKEMAEYADSLIAFWDGKSPGTANMIDLAEIYKLEIQIIKV